jgi:hypothetical protein
MGIPISHSSVKSWHLDNNKIWSTSKNCSHRKNRTRKFNEKAFSCPSLTFSSTLSCHQYFSTSPETQISSFVYAEGWYSVPNVRVLDCWAKAAGSKDRASPPWRVVWVDWNFVGRDERMSEVICRAGIIVALARAVAWIKAFEGNDFGGRESARRTE